MEIIYGRRADGRRVYTRLRLDDVLRAACCRCEFCLGSPMTAARVTLSPLVQRLVKTAPPQPGRDLEHRGSRFQWRLVQSFSGPLHWMSPAVDARVTPDGDLTLDYPRRTDAG